MEIVTFSNFQISRNFIDLLQVKETVSKIFLNDINSNNNDARNDNYDDDEKND